MPPCFKILVQSIDLLPFGYGGFVSFATDATESPAADQERGMQAREPVLVRIYLSG